MSSAENETLFIILSEIEMINIGISILTNAILIVVILSNSSKEFGSYAYLLLAFAINDIYFPLVHFFTLPVICSYGDMFLMFSHGILKSKFSICLFGCAFSQTMPLLANLFFYRYIAMIKPNRLRLYTKMNTFFLLFVTITMEQTAWFLNIWFMYHADYETKEYVQPYLDKEFPGGGKGVIGAYYYDETGLRVKALIGTMNFNLIMSICFSIIVFCSIRIVGHFRSGTTHWSHKTKRLQRGLFQTLVVQHLTEQLTEQKSGIKAHLRSHEIRLENVKVKRNRVLYKMIIPMIFVYFPCASIINLPIFHTRFNVYPNLVSVSLTLFPLIDAFVVLIGVKTYRKSILCCCVRRFHFLSSSTSGIMVKTTNERTSNVASIRISH